MELICNFLGKKGNFQDREKMRVEKTLRNLYGRFFFRFPDGESAADVYDRITGTCIDTYLYTHTHIYIVIVYQMSEILVQ